jgi:hypothetical protein
MGSKGGDCAKGVSSGRWAAAWEGVGFSRGGRGGNIYCVRSLVRIRPVTGDVLLIKYVMLTKFYWVPAVIRFSVFLEYFWRKNRLRLLNFSEGISLHGRLLVIL